MNKDSDKYCKQKGLFLQKTISFNRWISSKNNKNSRQIRFKIQTKSLFQNKIQTKKIIA